VAGGPRRNRTHVAFAGGRTGRHHSELNVAAGYDRQVRVESQFELLPGLWRLRYGRILIVRVVRVGKDIVSVGLPVGNARVVRRRIEMTADSGTYYPPVFIKQDDQCHKIAGILFLSPMEAPTRIHTIRCAQSGHNLVCSHSPLD
jgi:hypothetical protein